MYKEIALLCLLFPFCPFPSLSSPCQANNTPELYAGLLNFLSNTPELYAGLLNFLRKKVSFYLAFGRLGVETRGKIDHFLAKSSTVPSIIRA